MTDRIDIHKPLFAILAKLGLEPEDVRSLEITPRSVTATLYRRNERGAKFTEPSMEDYPVGDIDYQVATETKTFDVTTHKIEATGFDDGMAAATARIEASRAHRRQVAAERLGPAA